ncbi:rRNA maturation RNase YbeY [Aureimonas altamirensis]|uniref:rRNA maturation RNase YbeY n=1 Tax=Aureimonas altamirensis TaxID=370622 RepID=UPI0020373905|nr:rRNA maturation RNase YbeY [Aureimonas altamirensis]MCM2502289.1 rRNA maturation RNase YbeY [Aureimonas altamirensis]
MNDEPLHAAGFPAVELILSVEDAAWDTVLPDAERLVAEAAGAALAAAGMTAGLATEVGVTLADDEALRGLNAQWRGKDKPTNILSFPIVQLAPGDVPGPMAGDMVLARQTLEREALRDGKTLEDHFRHLIVHGMLHLLGYDHEEAEEAEEMERLEVLVLSTLAIADPYADSGGVAGVDPAE